MRQRDVADDPACPAQRNRTRDRAEPSRSPSQGAAVVVSDEVGRGPTETVLPAAARPGPGGLERKVLTCLTAAGRPMTAAEVLAELGNGRAYTTIATTLTRLYDKGALARRRSGRGYAYSVVGEPEMVNAAITARCMRRLVDAVGDRPGALAGFVAALDSGEARVLASLLAAFPADAAVSDKG